MTEREILETDVLIVGGGPAGLATAIHLADLANAHNEKVEKSETKGNKLPIRILLIEKGASFGSHTLSGAIVNPIGLKELLPGTPESDMPFEAPVSGGGETWFFTKRNSIKAPFHPPYMNNDGFYVASLGKIVRWLSGIAEKKGIQVFSGFSGHELLYDAQRVAGVQTGDSGVEKDGKPKENYQPGTMVRSKLTILAEGSRGHLTKALIQKFNLQGRNPQVYSIGVKELWEVPEGTFPAGRAIHSMGYPLKFDQFGGGFVYGMEENRVAIGLVAGLDYFDPTFDPHGAFQVYKQHPFIRRILEKGKMIRYGAKTIPEGGFFSIPKLYHGGVMIVGDSAGFLSMPSLKGIHIAIQSGMLAAKTAFDALKKGDTSARELASYEKRFHESSIRKDLWRVRNFRQGFKEDLLTGAVHFGAQLATGGHGLSLTGKLGIEEDAKHCSKLSKFKGKGFLKAFHRELAFDKILTFDKATDVFHSGSQHDEDQPCHLIVPDLNLCETVCIPKYGGPCQSFCPAEVYEIVEDAKTGKKTLHLHPTNCVHCKTCDIKDPFQNIRWVTPYGGDGPEYENM